MTGFEGFLLGLFIGWMVWGPKPPVRWRIVLLGVAIPVIVFGGLYVVAVFLGPETREPPISVPGVGVRR